MVHTLSREGRAGGTPGVVDRFAPPYILNKLRPFLYATIKEDVGGAVRTTPTCICLRRGGVAKHAIENTS